MASTVNKSKQARFRNPFRPGAGHMPPYLAGRKDEIEEFRGLLEQDTILKNLVLTGLRGLGKTVLLETFKPVALSEGWLWVGTDLSESMSINEDNMALRLLTDLAVATSSIVYKSKGKKKAGYGVQEKTNVTLTFNTLKEIYNEIPGLVADKLKGTLETVWVCLKATGYKGIIFAYDEAQNLADHSAKDQFPLSLLLDLFQSLQRKNCRYMLVLTGLPTLFPKLVEARTFAERMFTVMFLNPLTEDETEEAIRRPIEEAEDCPIQILPKSISTIWGFTMGYPYFVQYVCREVFDVWVRESERGKGPPPIPVDDITRKLDSDFFAGRWARATDRQRELLQVISRLPNCDGEFTVQEIVEHPANKEPSASFSSSHVNQMLVVLSEAGLVYKNRYAKYSLAVPLLADFIRRQYSQQHSLFLPFDKA
jgi:hypothetical protein